MIEFKKSKSGILAPAEERMLSLIAGRRSEDRCIRAFKLFPMAAREAIRGLIRKEMAVRGENGLELTPQGAALLGKSPCVERKAALAAVHPSAKKTPVFAHNLSKRFHRRLNANLPMKGSPEWTPKWEQEVARLNSRDGYGVGEIADTLDFIASDVSDFGFCFARNIRSLANVRMKWRNGLSKFATAYNAMMEKRGREERPARRFRAEFAGKWADEARSLHSVLAGLPHPDYSDERKRMGWEKCCAAIAEFLRGFAADRKWPASVMSSFGNAVSEATERIRIFNAGILVRLLKDFFANYKGIVGYIQDGNGGRPDDEYMDAVDKFAGEAEKWQ